MSTRREARERALSLCYEIDVKRCSVGDLLADLPVPPDKYAVEILHGVEDNREELDALIGKFAEKWSVERMPVIDRALLRIATWELAHRPEIPVGVSISEAVDLAKRYSTDDSGRFVNGLLVRLAEHLRDHPRKKRAAGR